MKGKDIFLGLQYVGEDLIELAEYGRFPSGGAKKAGTGRLKRSLTVAAIIALMLLLMGCAAVVLLHLNDLKIGEQTYTQHPLYLEDGTKTPATEKVKQIISVQGVAESPNQQAAKEWYEFTKAYDIAQKYPDGIPDFTAPDAYDAYWVLTQELVDKVDEICKKYDRKLAGEGALLLTQAEFDAL